MGRAEELFNEFLDAGEPGLEELIKEPTLTESLFLDFKRSERNFAKKQGVTKGHGDLYQLAKAISGFGNTEGGILVWGVRCKNNEGRDLPDELLPVEDPPGFQSWLVSHVAGATMPPHTGVTFDHFKSDKEPGKGYVLTLIPKSEARPHRCMRGDGSFPDEHYYLRAGSSFSSIPHDMLAGMFGRKPPPVVELVAQIIPLHNPSMKSRVIAECTLDLKIRNAGQTIVRDYYVYRDLGPAHQELEASYQMLERSNWIPGGNMRCQMSLPGARLAPEDEMTVGQFILTFTGWTFTKGQNQIFQCRYGCEGSPLRTLRLEFPWENLQMFLKGRVGKGATISVSDAQMLQGMMSAHSA